MAQTHVPTMSNLIDGNVGVLPTDVLFEVLLRLPADELCRLRLVCRPWRSLTCDPFFAKAHSSRHAHVLALEPSVGEIHVVDLSSGNVVKRIRVGDDDEDIVTVAGMSSQHDLVALSYGYRRRRVLRTRCEEEERKSLLDYFRGAAAAKKKNTRVFNLVTGAAAAANALPLEQPGPPPLLSPPTYILGHVASAGEYKVLRVARQLLARGDGGFDHAVSSHVTTLAAGDDDGGTAPQWRTTARPPLDILPLVKSHVVIGGTMAYFSARNGINGASGSTALALFDFATEQWRPTPLQGPPPVVDPSGGGGSTSFFRLSSLGGRLVGVHSTGDDDRESKADLWFFEDDGGGGGTDGPRWTKGYTMWFSPHLEGYGLVRPLLVLGDGRILAYWLPGRAGLGMLNLETGTWTTMATVDRCYSSVAVCQGSLLCPGIILNNRLM